MNDIFANDDYNYSGRGDSHNGRGLYSSKPKKVQRSQFERKILPYLKKDLIILRNICFVIGIIAFILTSA